MRRGGLQWKNHPRYRGVPRRHITGCLVREASPAEIEEFIARVNAIREARIAPVPPLAGNLQKLREGIEWGNRDWDR